MLSHMTSASLAPVGGLHRLTFILSTITKYKLLIKVCLLFIFIQFRLIELDEGIDALEAAIEFKNEAIAHRQKELRSTELTQVTYQP